MIHENIDTLYRPSPFVQTYRFRPPIGRLILRRVLQVIAWFENRRRLRRATEELMSLDNRMLADIGLTRADLYCALYGDPADRRWIERSS